MSMSDKEFDLIKNLVEALTGFDKRISSIEQRLNSLDRALLSLSERVDDER